MHAKAGCPPDRVGLRWVFCLLVIRCGQEGIAKLENGNQTAARAAHAQPMLVCTIHILKGAPISRSTQRRKASKGSHVGEDWHLQHFSAPRMRCSQLLVASESADLQAGANLSSSAQKPCSLHVHAAPHAGTQESASYYKAGQSQRHKTATNCTR